MLSLSPIHFSLHITSLSLSLSLYSFRSQNPTSLSSILLSTSRLSLSLSQSPTSLSSVLSLQSPRRQLHCFSLYQSPLLQVKKGLYVEEPKTTKKKIKKENGFLFIYLFLYRRNKPNRLCISFNNFISSSWRVCPTSNFDFLFNTIMCAQFICSM